MAATPLAGDAAKALALAIVTASQAPLLLLDADLNVVAASDSFLSTFGLCTADVSGRSLLGMGSGEWDSPLIRAALFGVVATGERLDALEADFAGPGGSVRNLVLKAQRLPFAEPNQLRILVTLIDGTEARAAAKIRDDLIHDHEILLGEIQHRVANSLQIIASLLLQDARSVCSEEGRVHLQEAHQRVMSVASLQRQLASSSMNDVIIRPYLEKVCQSIGASMLHDGERIVITVTGDDSAASGETSVSIGLIVTELVINALKYAFPDSRHGRVSVDYRSLSDSWELSVCDDGIGIQANNKVSAENGLGAAIIQALAKQLAATITVFDRHPGTGVSVVHQGAAGLLVASSTLRSAEAMSSAPHVCSQAAP